MSFKEILMLRLMFLHVLTTLLDTCWKLTDVGEDKLFRESTSVKIGTYVIWAPCCFWRTPYKFLANFENNEAAFMVVMDPPYSFTAKHF